MCTCVHASVCTSLWHSQQQKEKPLTVLLCDSNNMPEHPSPFISVLLYVHCHWDHRGYQGRGAQDIHLFLHAVPEHSSTPHSKSTLPWYNCHGWWGTKTKTIIYLFIYLVQNTIHYTMNRTVCISEKNTEWIWTEVTYLYISIYNIHSYFEKQIVLILYKVRHACTPM